MNKRYFMEITVAEIIPFSKERNNNKRHNTPDPYEKILLIPALREKIPNLLSKVPQKEAPAFKAMFLEEFGISIVEENDPTHVPNTEVDDYWDEYVEAFSEVFDSKDFEEKGSENAPRVLSIEFPDTLQERKQEVLACCDFLDHILRAEQLPNSKGIPPFYGHRAFFISRLAGSGTKLPPRREVVASWEKEKDIIDHPISLGVLRYYGNELLSPAANFHLLEIRTRQSLDAEVKNIRSERKKGESGNNFVSENPDKMWQKIRAGARLFTVRTPDNKTWLNFFVTADKERFWIESIYDRAKTSMNLDPFSDICFGEEVGRKTEMEENIVRKVLPFLGKHWKMCRAMAQNPFPAVLEHLEKMGEGAFAQQLQNRKPTRRIASTPEGMALRRLYALVPQSVKHIANTLCNRDKTLALCQEVEAMVRPYFFLPGYSASSYVRYINTKELDLAGFFLIPYEAIRKITDEKEIGNEEAGERIFPFGLDKVSNGDFLFRRVLKQAKNEVELHKIATGPALPDLLEMSLKYAVENGEEGRPIDLLRLQKDIFGRNFPLRPRFKNTKIDMNNVIMLVR